MENNTIHYYLGAVISLTKMPREKLCWYRFLSDFADDLYNAKFTVCIIVLKPLEKIKRENCISPENPHPYVLSSQSSVLFLLLCL